MFAIRQKKHKFNTRYFNSQENKALLYKQYLLVKKALADRVFLVSIILFQS